MKNKQSILIFVFSSLSSSLFSVHFPFQKIVVPMLYQKTVARNLSDSQTALMLSSAVCLSYYIMKHQVEKCQLNRILKQPYKEEVLRLNKEHLTVEKNKLRIASQSHNQAQR